MKCLKKKGAAAATKVHFQKGVCNLKHLIPRGSQHWEDDRWLCWTHTLPRLQSTLDASLFFIANAPSTAFREYVCRRIVDQHLTHSSCNAQESGAKAAVPYCFCCERGLTWNKQPLGVLYYLNRPRKARVSVDKGPSPFNTVQHRAASQRSHAEWSLLVHIQPLNVTLHTFPFSPIPIFNFPLPPIGKDFPLGNSDLCKCKYAHYLLMENQQYIWLSPAEAYSHSFGVT